AMVVPGCAQADTFALTLAVSPAGAGTAIDVTASGPYEQGEVVTIRAEAAIGFGFDGWTAPAGEFAQAGMAETTFTMPNRAVTVTANFVSTVREGGAWVDEIIITQESSAAASILKMQQGRVHVYGHDLTDTQLFETVADDPDLDFRMTLGGSRDFFFNCFPGPDSVVFPISGKLNPFAVAEIREAMNWMIDRDYAAEEVLAGMGLPLYTQFNPTGAETDRYADLIADVLAYYAYSPATGYAQIEAAMLDLGAVLTGGKWHFNGEPVVINQVIRQDLSPYPPLGDYFADVLEQDCNFTVNRIYATSGVAWGTYLLEDSQELFHIYGGGWGMPSVFRTEVHSFAQFNTHLVMVGYPMWENLEPWMEDPEWAPMYDAIYDLRYTNYSTMEERAELVEFALWEVMRFSNSIWSVAITSFVPFRAEVDMVLDACGGVSALWAQTIHFQDAAGNPQYGGILHMELPSILVQNMNPVAGSAMTYDIMTTRDVTGDFGLVPHPQTGLNMPQRIESATVTIRSGLPVGVSDTSPGYWCKLSFADTIAVPGTAWADWDAANQQWITASERFPGGTTAKRKSTVVYPADLWDLPMHDGTTLSPGDFMMSMIMAFDRGKEDSPIYDSAEKVSVESFLNNFKGFVIESWDPLTITTYSEVYGLDAEHSVSTWWPGYGTYGEFAPWHTVAVGKLAEKNNQLAFSKSKSDTLGVEWADYMKGPSLAVLASNLASAEAASYLPYAPTMGDYVDAAEIAERYAALSDWYAEKEHFWVSCGPFYVEAVYPIFKQIHLKAFFAYPDASEKWLWLLD
ncbi:MAG: InlB B-repeat-containing protein, partial [Dehalococcoidia bacterium]